MVIDKPGSPGHENAPRTILQAHMDMVCVAEAGREYDPLRDPITVINDGKTLTADGTSLGGDDGAGVAVAMTILEDSDAVHGPIRAVFTVDEEDGMLGADNLDPRHLDAEYMINLDWEEFGSLCCSSAGSDMYSLRRDAAWESAGGAAFSLDIRGLEGGHSGAQIHLGRASAIRMAARILRSAEAACGGLRLAAFRGGSAHNAIPSAAAAVAVVDADRADAFLEAARQAIDTELESCALTDPNAVITVAAAELPEKALSRDMTRDTLAILTEVHDGVIHQRSSEPAVTADMKKVFLAQAERYGYALTVLTSSPAWPVKAGSELVEICRKEYRALTGEEIRVEPVHAGLECGGFSHSNPALDIISIGPTILDIHSPRETLLLDTVYGCDALVRNILKDIALK